MPILVILPYVSESLYLLSFLLRAGAKLLKTLALLGKLSSSALSQFLYKS